MRRTLWLSAAVVVFAASGVICAQAQPQDQTSSRASQTAAPAAAPQQDPLAEAARKAREQRKDAPKAAKVFTNDNLPTQGDVSTVGQSPADTTPADKSTETKGDKSTPAPAAANDEKAWRAKFATLHHQLDQDQAALDVLQREAGVGMVQYYGGNPQKAAQDQDSQKPMGDAYEKKVAAIDAKKRQVEADKQAISDAEDELRRAGGDPAWAQ
jgi:hypothetical protein